ncbi:zinc finger BED domain-containing protein RICESLEEPER 1-like [Alnus glutinosa]|uniref:zinc finger BED domain-containing protein RICESLEEPER 1-like n=1 Tax=Alnus glutinosa TaxID=3517 RepID=UPI002D79F905|nr:zinc finger BED domain-containing protein RICESLEEPER 1-like [Alnus glutinosa]
MWTSAQRVSYMVVTCHFVDSDWFLQKRVLNFCNVPPPHSGVVIAEELRKCFGDWGIEDKVFIITVDNAKANDTTIRILKDDFELREVLPIGGRLFHVRCCAHITNLLVQVGLAKIGDIVDSVREGIKYIVASEAVQFKDVFPRYDQSDQAFQWLISPEEWEKVENVNQILSIFNDVANIVSGSEYPTSNLFLPEVWRIKEVLLLKCRDNNEYIRVMENSRSTSGSTRVAAVKAPIGRSRFLQHVRCNDVVRPAKTDLDVYLEDDIYICENDVNEEDIDDEFEALAWWKFNALKYRILSKMARGILAIPITTVASVLVVE